MVSSSGMTVSPPSSEERTASADVLGLQERLEGLARVQLGQDVLRTAESGFSCGISTRSGSTALRRVRMWVYSDADSSGSRSQQHAHTSRSFIRSVREPADRELAFQVPQRQAV